MYSRRGRGSGYHRSMRGRGGGGGGGRGNSWVRGGAASNAPNSTSSGPVLNGPKINRTWKRPEASIYPHSDGAQTKVEQAEVTKLQLPDETKLQPKALSNAPLMSKKGSNKLVRKDRIVSDSSETSTTDSSASLASNTLLKNVGGNKLVMKNKPLERRVVDRRPVYSIEAHRKPEPVGDKQVSRHDLNNSQSMQSKGRNKLVSENRLEEERLKETLKRKRIESKRGRAKGPAKRVRLENSLHAGEDNRDESQDEKLSDFAYQQTSKPNRRRKNMGLVRVAGAEDAPICPTFARGLPCTNLKCRKRHDVAREAPICSFFQRNGLCLKRDSCPFRHIKVNPHAMICSSFSLLGYCEDEDCQMKHVRSNSGKR